MTARELREVLIKVRHLDYDQFAAALDFGCESEAFTNWLIMQDDFPGFFLRLDDRQAGRLIAILIKSGEEVTMSKTKADLVKDMGLKNFDYALPQSWVDAARARGWEVVPHFVWSYDDDPNGVPYPLTEEGALMLCQMAKYI